MKILFGKPRRRVAGTIEFVEHDRIYLVDVASASKLLPDAWIPIEKLENVIVFDGSA